MKYENAYWEHATFLVGVCDVCGGETKHRCFDEPGADGVALKSLCDDHYKKDTQKDWLKRLKKRGSN